MLNAMQHVVASLEKQCARYLANAWTPYSHNPSVAFLVFEDSNWIPGVRIESASFPLTIPELINAVSTMHALKRQKPVLIHFSNKVTRSDVSYLEDLNWNPLGPSTQHTLILTENIPDSLKEFPLSPIIDRPDLDDVAGFIQLARSYATYAYVPESDFPVSCILETNEGQLIPGVNVEHADWTRTLCAERNALSTAISYGFKNIQCYYLSCSKAAGCTPCGACRQLIAELSPDAKLWMDQGNQPPLPTSPDELLPASFDGSALLRD